MYVPKSPLILCLEVTTKCNLNCPHCVTNADLHGTSLPQDKAISVIDEASRIGVKELVLGGGEVLLYNGFKEICEYALSRGINVSFATNGILIPEMIDILADLRTYNGSVRVGVSLDGYTAEMHSHFRPKETFEIALKAIDLLQNAKIALNVLCVLNKDNITKIPQFLEFVSALNVSDIRFIPLVPLGRGKNCTNDMLSPNEFYKIIIEKQKWNRTLKFNIGLNMPWEFLFQPDEERHPSPCEAGYLRLWINCNGDMYPCAYMPNFYVGNIYTSTISNVWNNSTELKRFRDSSLLKGICASCNFRDSCRGGCRGFAQFLEGDFLCSDPYCPLVNQKSFK